jgi:hypothetical protein
MHRGKRVFLLLLTAFAFAFTQVSPCSFDLESLQELKHVFLESHHSHHHSELNHVHSSKEAQGTRFIFHHTHSHCDVNHDQMDKDKSCSSENEHTHVILVSRDQVVARIPAATVFESPVPMEMNVSIILNEVPFASIYLPLELRPPISA